MRNWTRSLGLVLAGALVATGCSSDPAPGGAAAVADVGAPGPGPGDVVGIGGDPLDGAGADAPGPADGGVPDSGGAGDVGAPDGGPAPDVSAPDAAGSADGVVQDAADGTTAPGVCEDGSRRCYDGGAWACEGGAWVLDHDCAGPCVAGQCACLPSCAGKLCGPDGCGGSCGTCFGAVCDPETWACVTPPAPVVYAAVVVEDRWSGQCSGSNTPGADIRGAELFDASGKLLGTWSKAVAKLGDTCANNATDVSAVLGPPEDGDLSLAGGWVAGTFEGKNAILPGFSVTVHETGSQAGGTDEKYAVYLATDLDCPFEPDAKTTCMKLVSEAGLGVTSFTIPGSAP